MSSFIVTRALPTLALGMLVLPCAAAHAAGPHVKVEVRGIDGALRNNVLATLTIAHKDRRRNASEGYLRHLHARAEDEIRTALQPFGYYRPLIRSELVTGATWIARYEIERGPALLIDSLAVEVTGEGASDPKFQELVRKFPLKKGDPLVHPRYEAGKAAFEAYAAQGGYLDGRFTHNALHVDLENYRAAVRLEFASGPQHHFGDVTFEQDVVDPGILPKFLTFRRGDVFDYRKLLQLQTDLSRSGWFTRVEVDRADEELEEHREVPVVVRLSAARRLRFTAGAGYGTDDGARGRTLFELRRLNREGHHGTIDLVLGQLDRSASAQYFIPWLNPRTDMATFSIGYQDLHTTVSASKAELAGASLSRLLGPWTAAIALNYRREKFTVGPDLGTVQFLMPEASWSRVRADDRMITNSGDRVRLSIRGAHDSFFSDASFFQPRAEGKLIYGLGGGSRLVGRLDLGTTITSQFRKLPPTTRFFTGGAHSVRGYAFNSIGPRDSLGRVLGGEHLMVGSIEFDQMFLPRWGGAVFFDAGNSMNTWGEPLKKGVGVGLRWISPMGWVRADVGWGLDRKNRAAEFHVSVGPEL